jgi:hypothetical protein
MKADVSSAYCEKGGHTRLGKGAAGYESGFGVTGVRVDLAHIIGE